MVLAENGPLMIDGLSYATVLYSTVSHHLEFGNLLNLTLRSQKRHQNLIGGMVLSLTRLLSNHDLGDQSGFLLSIR